MKNSDYFIKGKRQKLEYKYDVTIAILNFNRVQFLDRAVRSCVTQLLTNKTQEVIVVDDFSTDRSREFLDAYKEKYKKSIKVFYNKKNMGIGYCSRLAVNKSKGQYFIRVDADDFLNRSAIDVMTDILDNNPQYGMVYCDHYRTDEWGIKRQLVKLNQNNLLNHGAGILIRKDLIKKVGNYKSNLREAEDYDIILKLQKICKPFHLPIPLYRYYIHSSNISKSGKRDKYIKMIKRKNSNE